MKGLFMILGNIPDDIKSLEEQHRATLNHIDFLNTIKNKFTIDIDIILSVYSNHDTQSIYELYNPFNPITINHNTCTSIQKHFDLAITKAKDDFILHEVDFIFYFKIDLFLEKGFFNIFNPWDGRILFPAVAWPYYVSIITGHNNKITNHPRIINTMLFVPKRFFSSIYDLKEKCITSNLWGQLYLKGISYNYIDTYINTYQYDTNRECIPIYHKIYETTCIKKKPKYTYFNKHKFMEKYRNQFQYKSCLSPFNN